MFIRSFDDRQINLLLGEENAALFGRLKQDVTAGEVFPAVRKNQLHFYYKGGCLYKFANGKFSRNVNFERFGRGTEGLDDYEKAKKQVKNKFTNATGGVTERQYLNGLYAATFGPVAARTVVLDIEVNLNGVCGGKKCDLVLYNTATGEITFAEAKIFSDSRVNVSRGRIPEVIEQVNAYSQAIAAQESEILTQYDEHARIVNKLFGTDYAAPKKLIKPARLLVFETPETPTDNGRYSIGAVTEGLGVDNVCWYSAGESPSTDEIWSALCR